jgi:hypothetical protein
MNADEVTYCAILTERRFWKPGSYVFGVRLHLMNDSQQQQQDDQRRSHLNRKPFFCAVGVSTSNISFSDGEYSICKNGSGAMMSLKDAKIQTESVSQSPKSTRIRSEWSPFDNIWIELTIGRGGVRSANVNFYRDGGERIGSCRPALWTPTEISAYHFCLLLWPGVAFEVLDSSLDMLQRSTRKFQSPFML